MSVSECLSISIHAAREGGDSSVGFAAVLPFTFQSTPPVKAATIPNFMTATTNRFQSTPPVKAATGTVPVSVQTVGFQSTPPVKAATDLCIVK